MNQQNKIPVEILRTAHRCLHRVMAQNPELVARVLATAPKKKAHKYPPGVLAMLRRADRAG
jgi:hypothetical protein